ncbi:hypothetical protein Y032_0371g122 [Ancylostoma ceylanicum]|uniref:Uncharacterized protein n=1 Tax=Ancylostoma ceylanicum TaxID=53326 RepID=A0A016RVB2_9BILA|nr:hypothetical protein Y032_0371g122 [Ancylostoma ceylanicum]
MTVLGVSFFRCIYSVRATLARSDNKPCRIQCVGFRRGSVRTYFRSPIGSDSNDFNYSFSWRCHDFGVFEDETLIVNISWSVLMWPRSMKLCAAIKALVMPSRFTMLPRTKSRERKRPKSSLGPLFHQLQQLMESSR